MSNFRPQAPWEFLLTASRSTLQSYELSRLAHASNLRKEIRELFDQLVDERSCAMVARCLMDERVRAVLAADVAFGEDPLVDDGTTAADESFVDQVSLPRARRAHD